MCRAAERVKSKWTEAPVWAPSCYRLYILVRVRYKPRERPGVSVLFVVARVDYFVKWIAGGISSRESPVGVHTPDAVPVSETVQRRRASPTNQIKRRGRRGLGGQLLVRAQSPGPPRPTRAGGPRALSGGAAAAADRRRGQRPESRRALRRSWPALPVDAPRPLSIQQ